VEEVHLIMKSHYNVWECCKLEQHEVDDLAGEKLPQPVAV